MKLFLSNFTQKIDKKGRVSVPSKFRDVLEEESFRGVGVAQPLSDLPCLESYGSSEIERIASSLERMNPLTESHDSLATAVLASLRQAPFDGEGRIMLNEQEIDAAGLDGLALFAGMGKKFQIWNPDRFAERQAEARRRARENADQLPWVNAKEGGS
ncbi:MAG: division/cell wall cluster transcriptional repressor MraZ [Pseudomonadota bacterium]